jgi:hypothetical protein
VVFYSAPDALSQGVTELCHLRCGRSGIRPYEEWLSREFRAATSGGIEPPRSGIWADTVDLAEGPWPALLIEPSNVSLDLRRITHATSAGFPTSGFEVIDQHREGLLRAGFQTYGPSSAPPQLDGWTLVLNDVGEIVVVYGPECLDICPGGVWLHPTGSGELSVSKPWLERVVRTGDVVLIVLPPATLVPPQDYAALSQPGIETGGGRPTLRAEYLQALTKGNVVAARIDVAGGRTNA